MLWTEINKTQPGGLRQPFPFISGHQNPSGRFANLDFFGGVHPADCTGEWNYPNKPRYLKQKPFQRG